MSIDPTVTAFGEWLAAEHRGNGAYDAVQVLTGDRATPSGLCVRLVAAAGTYYVVRVDTDNSQLEAGLATENRMLNESLEQMILDNGGDLDDLLGDELCDLGEQPLPMRHYFERPAFLFVVPLPLTGAGDLDDPALRKRVKLILAASKSLFQGCIDEA